MTVLILYTTKSGSTKQYAEWIHNKFPQSDLYNIEKFDASKISNYDFIIVGSPVYGGLILAADFLKGNWERLKDKSLYLMTVGAVPQEQKWSKKSFNLLPANIRNSLTGYIKLPGISTGMNGLAKLAMRIFLGVDTKDIVIQAEVQEKDMKPVYEFIESKLET